jgi:hypothetical protein
MKIDHGDRASKEVLENVGPTLIAPFCPKTICACWEGAGAISSRVPPVEEDTRKVAASGVLRVESPSPGKMF